MLIPIPLPPACEASAKSKGIELPAIALTKWVPEGAQFLVGLLSDPDTVKYCKDIAQPFTEQDALKYIHHFRSQMEYAVVAVNVETGEIQSAIGSVGLTIDAANGMKELGYVIEKKYQGLGIMTAVVDFFVKNVVGAVVKSSPSFLSKVYAFVDPENIASWLLLERVGFVQEGFLKKHQARKGVWFDQKLYAYYF